jgi:hypothetical protein
MRSINMKLHAQFVFWLAWMSISILFAHKSCLWICYLFPIIFFLWCFIIKNNTTQLTLMIPRCWLMLVIHAKVKVEAVVIVAILLIKETIDRIVWVQKAKNALIVVKLIMWLKIVIHTTRKFRFIEGQKSSISGQNRHFLYINWRPTDGQRTSINWASVNLLAAKTVKTKKDGFIGGLSRHKPRTCF